MMADFWGYPRDARCEVIAGHLARRISCREAAAGMKAERMAENIAAENLWSGPDNLDHHVGRYMGTGIPS